MMLTRPFFFSILTRSVRADNQEDMKTLQLIEKRDILSILMRVGRKFYSIRVVFTLHSLDDDEGRKGIFSSTFKKTFKQHLITK